jgi:hypothetical protein
LWPDPDIRWCQRAADTVLADGWRPDWVLSTSPPESIHVAAERIARQTGAKWAADFRDLWLEAPHRRERLRPHRRFGERMLARNLLPKANLVIAVDPVVAAEAARLDARNVHVLGHFTADTRPSPANLPKDKLNIVHAGSIALSDPDASISNLLLPFETAWTRNTQLRLHLVGRLTDAEEAKARASRAAGAIQLWGVLSFDEALSVMAAADALAFVASEKMHVPPSKIADYLMFEVPIVACGNGPWRSDPRVPLSNAVETMIRLQRGDRGDKAPRPLTCSEAVTELLKWMDVASYPEH